MTDDVRAQKATRLVASVLLLLAAWNLYREHEMWAWSLAAAGAALGGALAGGLKRALAALRGYKPAARISAGSVSSTGSVSFTSQ